MNSHRAIMEEDGFTIVKSSRGHRYKNNRQITEARRRQFIPKDDSFFDKDLFCMKIEQYK
jgi:hypothetical protein